MSCLPCVSMVATASRPKCVPHPRRLLHCRGTAWQANGDKCGMKSTNGFSVKQRICQKHGGSFTLIVSELPAFEVENQVFITASAVNVSMFTVTVISSSSSWDTGPNWSTELTSSSTLISSVPSPHPEAVHGISA